MADKIFIELFNEEKDVVSIIDLKKVKIIKIIDDKNLQFLIGYTFHNSSIKNLKTFEKWFSNIFISFGYTSYLGVYLKTNLLFNDKFEKCFVLQEEIESISVFEPSNPDFGVIIKFSDQALYRSDDSITSIYKKL